MKWWYSLWFWVLMVSSALCAGELDYRDYHLNNGLRVILLRTERAPLILAQVWYRVGAVDERPGKTGISHMLEHMMFKGTQTLKPGEYSRLISRQGGEDNAATSQDYTNYYAKLPADQLELALRLEADRMRNLVILEKELRSENAVVQEERRTRTENSPAARMAEKFMAEIFRNHPYGRPIIGTMEDITGLTVKDLQQWYHQFYAPNNAILVIVGDLQFDQAQSLVEQYFGPLPPDRGLQPVAIPREPPQAEPRRLHLEEKGVAIARWNMAFHIPTLADAASREDVYALDVLGSVLADGGSSRLYRKLVVEQKLALSIGVSVDGISREPGLFTLTATAKVNADLDRLEREIRQELIHLQENPVDESELVKVKNGLVADHVFAQDSVQHLAWAIGEATVVGMDWQELLIHYPDRVQAVTPAQIRTVTRRYLDPDKATVGILTPAKKK